MLGASGVTSANWLYNVAPKDGTAMGTFAQTVPLEPLFGNQQARYDAARFIWIGNMESSVAICGVTKASGVQTFEDMRKREVVMGATGPTGPLVKSALAVKNLLGAQIRVIPGYKGSADVKLAMNRGEVQGICGLPWSTVKSFWKQELDSGDFRPILQISGDKSPELPANVTHYTDFIKTDENRQLFGLLFGVQALGRIYATPPDVPADRIAALRKAFDETMKDKEFLADAEKTAIDIIPMDGATVAKMWTEFTSIPAAIVEQAKKVTKAPPARGFFHALYSAARWMTRHWLSSERRAAGRSGLFSTRMSLLSAWARTSAVLSAVTSTAGMSSPKVRRSCAMALMPSLSSRW